MSAARNPHGMLHFENQPIFAQSPTFLDALRHAADEDESTGHFLQAEYIRAAADEIEWHRTDPLRAACIAYVRSYQDVPMDDLRVWAARGSRRFELLITALELLAQEDAR